MRWTWDQNKAERNIKKHGVSFELAWRVMDDPLVLSLPDPCRDEVRWRSIGTPTSSSHLILFVVHTWPDNPDDADAAGRIITARRAEPHERKAYEEGEF